MNKAREVYMAMSKNCLQRWGTDQARLVIYLCFWPYRSKNVFTVLQVHNILFRRMVIVGRAPAKGAREGTRRRREGSGQGFDKPLPTC